MHEILCSLLTFRIGQHKTKITQQKALEENESNEDEDGNDCGDGSAKEHKEGDEEEEKNGKEDVQLQRVQQEVCESDGPAETHAQTWYVIYTIIHKNYNTNYTQIFLMIIDW